MGLVDIPQQNMKCVIALRKKVDQAMHVLAQRDYVMSKQMCQDKR